MKLQDNVVVGKNADGKDLTFYHPFFQCANMFVGELMCLFVYVFKIKLS
jgi:hypothetical protein